MSMKTILNQPGQVDLSAYVDFRALRKIAESVGCVTGGPMP